MKINTLKIAGKEFKSRLWVGTGKGVAYPLMRQCIDESGSELVTVAIRRIPQDEKPGEQMVDYLKGVTLLPNTAHVLQRQRCRFNGATGARSTGHKLGKT